MKLLIITQKVDRHNPYLGFFHRWIEEFAIHCEQIIVICLETGDYELPDNVRVLSLGKDRGQTRFGFLWHFYRYLWQERKNYDSVFVHMNPIYLVLAGFWWRLMGKKTSLWYTHKNVDRQLRLAEKFVDIVFTASPESFQLTSGKVKVVGHGIDIESFRCPLVDINQTKPLHIISVGRITEIKNLETLIRAMATIKNKLTRPIQVDFIGGEVTASDRQYRSRLDLLVNDLDLAGQINFLGPIKPVDLPSHYCEADLSVNMCATGGMDKAVLESFASGRPALVANETFRNYLGPELSGRLMFKFSDAEDLANKLEKLFGSDLQSLGGELSRLVKEKSSVSSLITKIIQHLS